MIVKFVLLFYNVCAITTSQTFDIFQKQHFGILSEFVPIPHQTPSRGATAGSSRCAFIFTESKFAFVALCLHRLLVARSRTPQTASRFPFLVIRIRAHAPAHRPTRGATASSSTVSEWEYFACSLQKRANSSIPFLHFHVLTVEHMFQLSTQPSADQHPPPCTPCCSERCEQCARL